MNLQSKMKLTMKLVLTLSLALLSLSPATTTAQLDSTTTAFKCSTAGSTCQGVVGYFLPNTTTLAALKRQFTVRSLRSILAVNNLPLTTKGTHKVEANQTVRIPFPCLCSNGTGISNNLPNYTIVPDDGLYHIAMDVYGGLVRYQEIAAVNGISDPSLIEVGKTLWIPLPCSCDEVDGEKVVHYGHVVQAGSTVEQIAQEFDVAQDTLMKLNGIKEVKDLLEGQVLDVPLRACTSRVRSTSPDYPLLLSDGTYALTANNCVTCKCSSANNFTLQCEQSQVVQSTKCGHIQCSGSGNLSLGNTTFSACSSTTCAYAGYTSNSSVLTEVDQVSTCPVPSSPSPPPGSINNQASKTSHYDRSLVLIGFVVTLFSSILHS